MKFSIKHIRSGRGLFLLMALIAFCSFRPAEAVQAVEKHPETGSYYDGPPKQGWYWYHDPVIEKKGKNKQDKQSVPRVGSYTNRQLYEMYPDQFQKLLKIRLKKAVQYPTQENVLNYLLMQDIARRKAAAFASTVQYVMQANAATFSVGSVYPKTTPGIEARVRMEQQEILNTIREARKDHAILFFWRPGCGYCEKQADILKYFTNKYGWQVRPINITVQPGLAARFNITVTPTLFLIQQGSDNYMTISVGVVSLSEMEQNLYRAVRYLKGDTDPETFTSMKYQKGGPLDPKSILERPKEGL